MRLREILPGQLYVSGCTHNTPSAQCRTELVAHGITTVINLWSRPDQRVKEMVPFYEWWPIPDGQIKDGKQVNDIAHYAADMIDRGNRVLIHCHAGRNRSGLIAAMVVKQLLTIDGMAAVDWVRTRRPNALANEHFVEYLRTS